MAKWWFKKEHQIAQFNFKRENVIEEVMAVARTPTSRMSTNSLCLENIPDREPARDIKMR